MSGIGRFNYRIEVTCDLIPLAVLKRKKIVLFRNYDTESHVISYRLRY